jgi:serine/threonine-protein kinase
MAAMNTAILSEEIPAIRCTQCGLELDAGIPICPNDGTRVGGEPTVGELFQNRYECVERVASGGMGVVYKARQLGLNRIVALKVLQSANLSDNAIRRFNLEAQSLAGFDHPHLVRVFEAGVTAFGQSYTVMEFIDGHTLDVVCKDGRLSLDKALDIFIQICEGLQYVHSRGILHRDLKPSNIMLTDVQSDHPKVKLLDFGIAKVIDRTDGKSLTQTGEVFGSPNFMSPEQAKGIDMDRRSDLYSVGCLMYDVLTGSPPFAANSAVGIILKQVSEKHRSLNYWMGRTKYPNALEAIVDRLLEKDPSQRYQTAEELRKDLLSLRSRQSNWYHIKLPNRQPTATKGRSSIALAAAAFALVLSLAAFVVCTLLSDKPDMTKVSLLDEGRIVDDVFHTSETKYLSSTGNNDINLSNIAVLKQNDQMNSDDKLDLRGANAGSFKYIKERQDNYITELRTYRIDDKSMPYITQLPLFSLEMRDAPATDASLKYIVGFHALNHLELSGMHLTQEDCKKLLQLKRLNSLALDHCGLDDACVAALTRFKLMNNLCLAENADVTNAAAKQLAAAQQPITVLDLGSTSINDDAAPYLEKLPDLQELHLNHTVITDKSLPALAKLNSLRWLDLENTAITADGLAQFRPVGLLRLNVANCQVSGEAIKEFKRHNKECAVYQKEMPQQHVKLTGLNIN